MASRAPLTLLLNAIIERLINDPRWIWPIYQATGKDPGSKYLYIDTRLRPINYQVKGYVDRQYLIAFDAYRIEPETRGRISSGSVMDTLETAENIITLSKYGKERVNLFDFSGKRECMLDVGHIDDTPAHIVDESNNMVYARQIIGFMIRYAPGPGTGGG